jgi:hypothetical protein
MVLCSLLLTGCNPFGAMRSDSTQLQTRGWADVSPQEPPQPLQCYRTLGDLQCYETRLPPNQENRFVGEYDPYIPPEPKNFIEKMFDQRG